MDSQSSYKRNFEERKFLERGEREERRERGERRQKNREKKEKEKEKKGWLYVQHIRFYIW